MVKCLGQPTGQEDQLTIAGVKEGDIVQVDVKGDVFYGLVEKKEKRELLVRRVGRPTTIRTVTARQVKARFKRMGC
jgi:hypothetical protein